MANATKVAVLGFHATGFLALVALVWNGLGLMIGIELDSISAADVVAKAREKGVLLLTAKQKVSLLPPLVISDEQIEHGVAVLAEILGE